MSKFTSLFRTSLFAVAGLMIMLGAAYAEDTITINYQVPKAGNMRTESEAMDFNLDIKITANEKILTGT